MCESKVPLRKRRFTAGSGSSQREGAQREVVGQEPQRGAVELASTLSGKESLRLQRLLLDEEEDDDAEKKEVDDDVDDVENSLRNRAVFGILNWKWRSNTGSEYTLPTSGDGLHKNAERIAYQSETASITKSITFL